MLAGVNCQTIAIAKTSYWLIPAVIGWKNLLLINEKTVGIIVIIANGDWRRVATLLVSREFKTSFWATHGYCGFVSDSHCLRFVWGSSAHQFSV